MTEISLKLNGIDLFEYYSESIPRKGELMRLDVDEEKGTYEVIEVIHHVFRNKKDNKILAYVETDLKEVLANAKD